MGRDHIVDDESARETVTSPGGRSQKVGVMAGAGPGSSSSPDTLLLVDDNPTNLQVLVGILKEEGYKLLVAKDGESALKIAAKARPCKPGLNTACARAPTAS